MKGLITFIGETFRTGGQCSRIRGEPQSYDAQICAAKRHIEFIEHILQNRDVNHISVVVSTYSTSYTDELLEIYKKYLIKQHIYDDVIGLNNLFHNSLKEIDLREYDFIFYIRADLFLKDRFFEIFDPTIPRIVFPTICWKHDSHSGRHPRVSDMTLFIPKNLFYVIPNMIVCHELWQILADNHKISYDDLDTMINTYHDSDSYKDFNPLYYIVNRPENPQWHSEGHIFDKNNF